MAPADLLVLDCGCKTWTGYEEGEPTFFYQPCSRDCYWYNWTLEEARKGNLPIVEKRA